MLDKEAVYEVLQDFLKEVTRNAKRNLKARKKITSKDLYNSITSDLETFTNSLTATISMEDYGKFEDKGVKGVGGMRKTLNGKKLDTPIQWKLKRVVGSPYRYRNLRPPARFLRTWAKKKRGVFRKRGDKGLGYAIAESVYRTGIETTNFFTEPFEKAFAQLPDDLIEAYGLDVENFIEFTLKEK